MLRLFCCCCPVLLALACLTAETSSTPSTDEKLLQDNKLPTDGPGLVKYLQRRAGEKIDEKRIAKLIADLGEDAFETRENASSELVRIGNVARKALLKARTHRDPEIRQRAARCLTKIEKGSADHLAVDAAAVRVLVKAKPPGVIAALLTYLPAAADDSLAEEVRVGLATLALTNGKADPGLVDALKDSSPVKRAAAAVALCRAGSSDHLPAIRKLLTDKSPAVRFQTAVALAALREKEAVPVLIALLDQTDSALTGRVEEFLCTLAGDKAPALPGATKSEHEKYRKGWERWWKNASTRFDLKTLEQAAKTLGHTTVVMLDRNRVVALDGYKRPLWQFDDLKLPLDVQRLGEDKVLVAEFDGNRVTERNKKGEVVWEKKVTGPIIAQRMADGSTFIANRQGIIELDKTGKETGSYTLPNNELILRARKMPNGEIALIAKNINTHFVKLDKTHKEVARFVVEVATSGGRIDLTREGNVLIPEKDRDRVVEYDMKGKKVRVISVSSPIVAGALPNGHVIVTSMDEKRAIEFDRAGKEVWEYRRDTRVTRAVRP